MGKKVDIQESLNRLKSGNERFFRDHPLNPHQTYTRRQEVLEGQTPFAAILTCSDSRVSPEILFDQGIGDLFVVRNAGNIVDEMVIASLEYAVMHLNVPLVVVMGHQMCGAVTAALKGGEAEGHIPDLINKIAPSIHRASGQAGDALTNAIDANVAQGVEALRRCEPILAGLYADKQIAILGAWYDLETGMVIFL